MGRSIKHIHILPIIYYRCEVWSVTLREEQRWKVFEDVVLKGIFGLNWGELIWKWKNFNVEEPNAKIFTVIKSWAVRWEKQVACMKTVRSASIIMERVYLKNHSIDGRTVGIRKWCYDGVNWLGVIVGYFSDWNFKQGNPWLLKWV